MNFDDLPNSALVRLPTLQRLFSVSAPTIWRWAKNGELPKPLRVGGITCWRVGDLRAKLNSLIEAGSRGQP
jgi:predicted DNA-binding transcriptional regulator AlpA